MTKYTSNNYFLFDKIMYILIFLGITGFATYRLANNNIVLLMGVTIITILSVLLIRLLSKLVSVELTDKEIVVNHLTSRNQTKIAYNDIFEFQHQFWYPVFSRNRIKYNVRQSNKFKTLKIRSIVPNGEFNDFASWLKNKNSSISFTFTPSDSPVEEKYKGKD